MKPLLLTAAVAAVAALAVSGCGGSSGASPAKTITVTSTPSGQPSSATSTPSAGASSSTPAAAAGAAGCLSRYLHGSTGLTQGATGSEYVVIRFKNLNNVPCTLYGFPGVALATGTPVTDVGQPSAESTTTTRELVILRPGGYANATLQIAQALNFPAAKCSPEAAHWLAVIPPNQQVPLFIPFTSTACKGPVKLLTVTAVRPGNGG
jgi:Protein of unknown function (DUF4232)